VPTIFVDANIFLDCYRRQHRGYRELLRSLCGLRSYVFITDTVITEIERNRTSVYSEANKLERKSISLGILEMYSHYSEETTDVDETNKEIRSLDNDVKRSQADLQRWIEEIHEKKSSGNCRGKGRCFEDYRRVGQKCGE
jgi:predicted nucleic acid-binding protein